VTWANTKRTSRKADNRRRHHEDQISRARTPRQRLWAACSWLVVEAWKAGVLDEAFELVLTKVHEIREKEAGDDEHLDYAA
jgi:hypothetical protein